jgi:uncharacterized protein YcfJ
MKKSLAFAVLAALSGSGMAAPDLVDTAQVVSSTPIVEHVTEPRQECTPVAAAPQEHSLAGPILGGVAGAILGHQVGHGSGQTAATAAGAVVGTIAGDRVGNPESTAPAQQCHTVQTTRDVVKGYTVVYRYYDRDITTTLPYNPGSTVHVGVGVVDNAPVAASTPPQGGRGSHNRYGRSAPASAPQPAPGYDAPPPPPAPVSVNGGYQYHN